VGVLVVGDRRVPAPCRTPGRELAAGYHGWSQPRTAQSMVVGFTPGADRRLGRADQLGCGYSTKVLRRCSGCYHLVRAEGHPGWAPGTSCRCPSPWQGREPEVWGPKQREIGPRVVQMGTTMVLGVGQPSFDGGQGLGGPCTGPLVGRAPRRTSQFRVGRARRGQLGGRKDSARCRLLMSAGWCRVDGGVFSGLAVLVLQGPVL